MAKSLWEKLREKIKEDTGLECAETFNRIRASRNDRECGAWSWSTHHKDYPYAGEIGSTMTMTDLMKCEKIEVHRMVWGDYDIYG